MRIGIDIDNVIANTYNELYPFFHAYMGREIDPHQVVETMRKHKIRMIGYFYTAWKKKVMSSVSLIQGAAETIRLWHNNHHITLVTSRSFIFRRQTRRWLTKNSILFHQLHFAQETTKHSKIDNCDVFIEDNFEECEILADHCKQVLMLDYPWNQKPLTKKNIVRVKNWDEIKTYINNPHPRQH